MVGFFPEYNRTGFHFLIDFDSRQNLSSELADLFNSISEKIWKQFSTTSVSADILKATITKFVRNIQNLSTKVTLCKDIPKSTGDIKPNMVFILEVKVACENCELKVIEKVKL